MGLIAISLATRRVLNAPPVTKRQVRGARSETKLPLLAGAVILLQASLTGSSPEENHPIVKRVGNAGLRLVIEVVGQTGSQRRDRVW